MVTSSTARYVPSADATFTYPNIRPIQKTFLWAYFEEGGKQVDVTNEDVSKAIKCTGLALEYPIKKGFQLLGLIYTLLEVGAQTHSPLRDVQIHKSKK
jgi:hypothetical protein